MSVSLTSRNNSTESESSVPDLQIKAILEAIKVLEAERDKARDAAEYVRVNLLSEAIRIISNDLGKKWLSA